MLACVLHVAQEEAVAVLQAVCCSRTGRALFITAALRRCLWMLQSSRRCAYPSPSLPHCSPLFPSPPADPDPLPPPPPPTSACPPFLHLSSPLLAFFAICSCTSHVLPLTCRLGFKYCSCNVNKVAGTPPHRLLTCVGTPGGW